MSTGTLDAKREPVNLAADGPFVIALVLLVLAMVGVLDASFWKGEAQAPPPVAEHCPKP